MNRQLLGRFARPLKQDRACRRKGPNDRSVPFCAFVLGYKSVLYRLRPPLAARHSADEGAVDAQPACDSAIDSTQRLN